MFQYELEEENEFEVEWILDKNTSQYLIKWKNYDKNKKNYEKKEYLTNWKKKIRQYK